MSSVPDSLERLDELFRFDPRGVDHLIEPDFRRYFASSFHAGKLLDYSEEAREYLSLTRWCDRVLDFGCGYGVMSICLRAAGVKEVIGTDVRGDRIRGCMRLAKLVGCGGLTFVAGDTHLQFPQGSFDGVLVKDALSHLPMDDEFFANAFRVLRPGGVLLISEDRNALNPRTQLATRRLWHICEFGSGPKLNGYGLQENWRHLRELWLQEHCPELSRTERRSLATATRGYTNNQLDAVIAAKRNRSSAPERVGDCVDPVNGILQERLVHPLHLMNELRDLGFQVSIAPPRRWSGSAVGRLLKNAWPLTIPAAPYFYVIARKPHTNGQA